MVRFSMTMHSARYLKRQLGIFAEDSEDLQIIGNFLQKYRDTLAKYVKRSSPQRNLQENVIELEEDSNNEKEVHYDTVEIEKQSKKQSRKESKNVEEEF